jgi:hypothetical protein
MPDLSQEVHFVCTGGGGGGGGSGSSSSSSNTFSHIQRYEN